jgi:hypothetical protein
MENPKENRIGNENIKSYQNSILQNNKNNLTNQLIEDSLGLSNHLFTYSAIQRQFNNTNNLINDKTSILFEGEKHVKVNKRSNIEEELWKSSDKIVKEEIEGGNKCL